MADVTNDIMTNDKTKILSGEFLNFYTPRRQRIRSFKVYFSPKQEGSGIPSPENVRPISGWTGVEVGHCGKNLIDPNTINIVDGYRNDSGIVTQSANSRYTINSYNVSPSTSYILSNNEKYFRNVRVYYLTENDEWISRSSGLGGSGALFTTPKNCRKVQFQFNIQDSVVDLQLEKSPITSYTPYKTNLLIPKEYQEVEYLESTGTQWIATNYAPENSPNAEWKCLELATDGENGLFGRNASSANRYFYDTYYGSVYIYRHKKVIRGNYRFVADFTKKPYEAIFTDNTLEVKNYGTRNLSGNISYSDTSGLPFYIFAINGAGAGWLPHHGARLYYLRFYENDTLSANFIPCYRKSDKVAGMYDAVSGQFYINSGTGEFITGPAVNRYDIDWSEDVGTVYGGYVDLVSGELVEEYICIDGVNNMIWTLGNPDSYNGINVQRFNGGLDNGKTFKKATAEYNSTYKMCNIFLPCSGNSTNNNKAAEYFSLYTHAGSTYIILSVQKDRLSSISIDGLKEYLAANNFQAIVPISEPITHQLSPTTLSTLMWDNNFWSNADRIEIEYDYIGIFDPIESRKNIFTATPHTVTAKDSIISFGTDMAADLKECKVWFLPKQDLHGYDKPWIGGSGKNILDISQRKNGYYINNDGQETAYAGFGYTTDFTPVNGDTIYTISGTLGPAGNFNSGIYYYDINKEWISRTSFRCDTVPYTFTTPENCKYIHVQFYGTPSDVQLELGSTATAYEPYSNICPIEGWDGITLDLAGVNFASKNNCVINRGTSWGGTPRSYGNFSNYNKCAVFVFRIPKGQTFKISCLNSDDYWVDRLIALKYDTLDFSKYSNGYYGYRNYVYYYNVGSRLIKSTITPPEEADALLVEVRMIEDNVVMTQELLDNLQISCVLSNYEPNTETYNGTSITIPFEKTIYGGYVDLVNGEVVETWKSFIADGTESSYPQNSSQRFSVPTDTINKNLLYERTSANHLISDKLLNIGANGMGKPEYRVAILSNQYLQMKITSDINTPELFREWLISNNVQTVCELATPNTYPIDPHTLTTLRGANTIWSNSNSDVEITYWKHGDDAYQHVPSSPITSNDNFIIVTDDGYAIGEEDDFIVY